MARCEDFPCCGHESGCCPDYDPQTGEQLNMKCTCGATLPINSRYSICDTCMNMPEDGESSIYDCLDDDDYYEDEKEFDSLDDHYYDDEEEEI